MRVYLSCDPSDRPLVEILGQLLERSFKEADIFIADHDPARTKPEDLGEQLRSSKVIVPLLTARSCNNAWVLFEAGAGMKKGATLPIITPDLRPEDLPAPLQLLPLRHMTRRGLTRLLEDTAAVCLVSLPAKLGVQEALYRLQAQLSPPPTPRKGPPGATPTVTVRQRVDRLISRTHTALVMLIVNGMSPGSALAEQDLDSMRLDQLRDIADYASISYPTFLLYTLSSLQTSLVEGDDASWSLFNEEGQLARLERNVEELERTAFLDQP